MWQTFCLFSLAQLILALAVLLRLTPNIVRFGRHLLRALFILTFRFYRLLLHPIAPWFKTSLSIDLLKGAGRVGATVTLSLLIGLPLTWLLGGSIPLWSVGCWVGHGLVTGLVWDEIQSPAELQMGVSVP